MSKTAALWNATQAAQATGGEARGEWCADGISIDSRALSPGDLFVALKGSNHDGHDHGGYGFDHTTIIYLMNKKGNYITHFSPNDKISKIVEKINNYL